MKEFQMDLFQTPVGPIAASSPEGFYVDSFTVLVWCTCSKEWLGTSSYIMIYSGVVNPISHTSGWLTSRRFLRDIHDCLPLLSLCVMLVNAVWLKHLMPNVPTAQSRYKMKNFSTVISMFFQTQALAYPCTSNKNVLAFFRSTETMESPSSSSIPRPPWTSQIWNVWCTLKISGQWWKTWCILQVSPFILHISVKSERKTHQSYFTCCFLKMSDPFITNSHTDHSIIQISDSLQQIWPIHLQINIERPDCRWNSFPIKKCYS